MKTIIKGAALVALSLLWAACGHLITAFGLNLNTMFGVEWAVYVLWGCLAGLFLLLLVPLLVSLCRAVFSGAPLRFRYMMVWGGIALLLYFASDLVDKGIALNQLTRYPLLGYLFWFLIAFFLYWQVISPIVSFLRLTTFRSGDLRDRSRAALLNISVWRSAAKAQGRADYTRWDSLRDQLHNARSSCDHISLQRLLDEYSRVDELLPGRSRALINTYCQIAALTVVISRNRWLDGLALMFLQLRLLIALARLHGGRPSPVFNALCFGAVILNSFVYVILNSLICDSAAMVATELVDDFADLLIDDPDVQYKAGNAAAKNVPIFGMLAGVTDVIAKPVLEAALAASNVYVTGHLFLRRLQGEARVPSFRDVVALRRSGRLEIVRRVMSALRARCADQMSQAAPESAEQEG